MKQSDDITTNSTPVLMTMKEASDALQVSHWTLYQLINQRRLNTVKIGRRRFIAREDLHAFLAELRQEGGE